MLQVALKHKKIRYSCFFCLLNKKNISSKKSSICIKNNPTIPLDTCLFHQRRCNRQRKKKIALQLIQISSLIFKLIMQSALHFRNIFYFSLILRCLQGRLLQMIWIPRAQIVWRLKKSFFKTNLIILMLKGFILFTKNQWMRSNRVRDHLEIHIRHLEGIYFQRMDFLKMIKRKKRRGVIAWR